MNTVRTVRRTLALARCASGYLLLSRPAATAHLLAPTKPPPPTWLIRVLGGREFTQGLIQLVAPSDVVISAGALVDTIHAATMLPAIWIWPQHWRTALASGGEAALAAAMATATFA